MMGFPFSGPHGRRLRGSTWPTVDGVKFGILFEIPMLSQRNVLYNIPSVIKKEFFSL